MHRDPLPQVPAAATAAAAAAASAAHPQYRPDIDGLRAVAVLSVLAFHAFPGLLPGGFIGVDIFFVISGYLISSILLASLRQGRFSIAEFYRRRIRRIFPALALVMASCAAFGWLALFPDEYKMLGKHMMGGAGFVSNLLLWNEVGYFDRAADSKPLLHLWSLAVEEQFYIVWPLLLWLGARRRMVPLLVLLGLASLALNLHGVALDQSAAFYSPASRMWELMLGALLAGANWGALRLSLELRSAPLGGGAARQRRLVLRFGGVRARRLASAAGLLLIGLGLALAGRGRPYPGAWALLPTLGAALLIAAGPRAWCNRVLLSARPLVWVGLISYPLYLWHWPLLAFLHIVDGGLLSRGSRLAALAAALLLAWLTCRYAERPLRDPANGARKAAGLALGMLLLAAAGAWIYRHDGLPARSGVAEGAARQQALVLVEDKDNAAACKRRYGFAAVEQFCLLDEVGREPTVALIGDSHAHHLVGGLTRYYHGRGENLWYLGTRVPFFGLAAGDDPYQRVTGAMLELALNTPSVHTVILSSAVKLHRQNPEGEALVRGLRATLERFLASGRRVVYVYDLPLLDFEPRDCIRRAGLAAARPRGDCSVARAVFNQNVVFHAPTVAAVLKDFPQVQVLDTAAQLCDARRCQVIIDGKLMYRDTHHLSRDGDLYVGERFGRQLAAWPRRAGPALPLGGGAP